MHHQFVHVTFLTHALDVIDALQALELSLVLGIGPLARLFLKDQNKEGSLFLAFCLFRATMEENGNLVDFYHHV